MTNDSQKKITVYWLWITGYWDGALSGVVEYQGKKYYASATPESVDDPTLAYSYNVYDLPESVWADLIKKHDLFVEKVGTNMDCIDGNRMKRSRYVNLGTSDEFYAAYPSNDCKRLDVSGYPMIGWCE